MTSKWPDKIELLFQASVDPLDTEIPGDVFLDSRRPLETLRISWKNCPQPADELHLRGSSAQ